MAKFHINPTSGNPGLCNAAEGNCPYGGPLEHYSTAEDARHAYEKVMSRESWNSGSKPEVKKTLGVPCGGGCGKLVMPTGGGDMGDQGGPWYCDQCAAQEAHCRLAQDPDNYFLQQVAASAQQDVERSQGKQKLQSETEELASKCEAFMGSLLPGQAEKTSLEREHLEQAISNYRNSATMGAFASRVGTPPPNSLPLEDAAHELQTAYGELVNALTTMGSDSSQYLADSI